MISIVESVIYKIIYAAPSYVSKHGAPRTIEELQYHEYLTFSNFTQWQCLIDGEEQSIRVSSRFSSSGVDGFIGARVDGHGLAQLSARNFNDEMANCMLLNWEGRCQEISPFGQCIHQKTASAAETSCFYRNASTAP